MRLRSLRARVTMTFTVAIAVLLLIVSGALIVRNEMLSSQKTNRMLTEGMRRLKVFLTTKEPGESHIFTPPEAIAETTEAFYLGSIYVAVRDQKGNIWRSSNGYLTSGPQFDREVPGWRTKRQEITGFSLLVGRRLDTAARWYEAELLLLLSLFVVIIAALGSWVLVGRTLMPIQLLSRQAQTASVGSSNVILSPPSPDAEVVHLVTTLNGLLNRIARTAAAKGLFYAAASHELRTPLQVLSGRIELTLSRARTGEEYRAALYELQDQTERLTTLVKDLLVLNRLDTSTPPEEHPIDLVKVCERILETLSPLIIAQKLSIETRMPTCANLVAPQSFVEMLVSNTLENAVKYAVKGSIVRISITETDSLTLEISNDSPPLTVTDTNLLFEPFYRPDRARNAESGGNGLGLAICKAIAESQGWEISLTQGEPKANQDVVRICVRVCFGQIRGILS